MIRVLLGKEKIEGKLKDFESGNMQWISSWEKGQWMNHRRSILKRWSRLTSSILLSGDITFYNVSFSLNKSAQRNSLYDSALSPPPTSLFLVVSTIPYWLNNIPQHFSDLSCFPLAWVLLFCVYKYRDRNKCYNYGSLPSTVTSFTMGILQPNAA